MRVTKSSSAIISSFLLVSAAAFAQQATPDNTKAPAGAKFKRLDVNGNSAISKEEAVKMKGQTERFETADVNKDGKLEKAEFDRAKGA